MQYDMCSLIIFLFKMALNKVILSYVCVDEIDDTFRAFKVVV
jgi:hypothetical protein